MSQLIYETLASLIPVDCTIIEIGAHIGTDTRELYYRLAPKLYYAIEPDNRNIIELIKLRLPIQIIKGAVSSTNGVQSFWLSSGHTPHGRLHTDSNSLLEPMDNPNRPGWIKFRQDKVQCFKLDDIHVFPDTIDLIWMDIQGAELLAIQGGFKTLAKTKYLYTECQENRYYNQPGLHKILQALPGWELIERFGDNALLKNKSTNSDTSTITP